MFTRVSLIDWFVFLAPLLLIPIVLLLVFVGCKFHAAAGSFLGLTVKDTGNMQTATVNVYSTTAEAIDANPGDVIDVNVSSNNDSVLITQSTSGADPWSTILSLSLGANGGMGDSQFTIPQGMASFFLRAESYSQGQLLATPAIEVKIAVLITRVQGNARGTSTTPTISIMLTQSPANGNLLILTCATYGTTRTTVSSISQTSVTWTRQVDMNSGNNRSVEIWAGMVGTGASQSITVNLSGAPSFGAVANVCEYSGLATSGFLDQTTTNTGVSTIADTGTTTTTAQANELWIGNVGTGGNVTQSSPTNGFTLLDGGIFNANVSDAYLEKIASAIGAANSGTILTSNTTWTGCVATFRGAA